MTTTARKSPKKETAKIYNLPSSRAPVPAQSDRNVITEYYLGKNVVKRTASKYPNNAVVNCTKHMQTNEYGAHHAEVYDTDGKVHAVVIRKMLGGEKTMIKTIIEGEIDNLVEGV